MCQTSTLKGCSETSGLQPKGLLRELNPGPLAPEARIIPLDQAAGDHQKAARFLGTALTSRVHVHFAAKYRNSKQRQQGREEQIAQCRIGLHIQLLFAINK